MKILLYGNILGREPGHLGSVCALPPRSVRVAGWVSEEVGSVMVIVRRLSVRPLGATPGGGERIRQESGRGSGWAAVPSYQKPAPTQWDPEDRMAAQICPFS